MNIQIDTERLAVLVITNTGKKLHFLRSFLRIYDTFWKTSLENYILIGTHLT